MAAVSIPESEGRLLGFLERAGEGVVASAGWVGDGVREGELSSRAPTPHPDPSLSISLQSHALF